jgi:hypothetical protein
MWAAVTRRFLIHVYCFCVLGFVPTGFPNKMVNLVTQFRSSFLSEIYPTYTSSSEMSDSRRIKFDSKQKQTPVLQALGSTQASLYNVDEVSVCKYIKYMLFAAFP